MLTRVLFALALTFAAMTSIAQPVLNPAGPKVLVDTSLGEITIELLPTASPVTVENFLRYVRTQYYNGSIFHRVLPGFMVQGGGIKQNFKVQDTFKPIPNESNNGLSNVRGTVAMARLQSPQSATSQFFINLVDNKELDYANGTLGYAVFGRVIDGMQVVDEIARQPQGRHRGMFKNAPNKNVVIREVRLLESPAQ